MKLLWLAISGLVLFGAVAAACGGDDDKGKSAAATAPSDAGTAPAEKKGDTPAPTQASAGSPSAQGTAGSGQVTGSGADALRKLAKDLSTKTYQVSYDFETADGGKTTKTSVTLAQKPPKTATSIQAGASGQAFTIINDGTNSYTCSKDPSGSTGGQCIKGKADSNPLTANVFSLDKTLGGLSENINVTEAGGRTVAGVDSRCFTVKEATTGENLACFSKTDGIAVYIEAKTPGGSTTKIQATKISTSVDDSLFVPPAGYKIVEAPAR